MGAALVGGLLKSGAVAANDVVVVEARAQRFAVGVDAVIELAAAPRTGLATLDLEQVADAVFGPTP